MDAQGNMYGTTFDGGAYGDGTVFKVDPSSNETVLHSFTGGSDGYMPYAGLVMDAQGNLYGATFSSDAPSQGNGVVFKLDPAGNETVLYTFTGGRDGAWPFAAMIMDAGRNLYGTTYVGGNLNLSSGQGGGTVFKVDPSGNETVLHSFTGSGDGELPEGSLIMDQHGNLYGTTTGGGTYDFGTVFKLDPSGNETILYSFTGGDDGLAPVGGLVMDAANNLYGTTSGGGAFHNCYGFCGTVFKLAIQTKAAATTTSLASSLNPAGTNQGITFKAVVSSQNGGAVTGTVTFMAGEQILGGVALSGNVASLTTSFATAGTYSITARYNGDSSNTGSTSGAFSEKITAATTITLISSPNPSVVGQTVVFRASVTSPAGFPANGETLTFYEGTAALGTALLSAGAATLTTSALPAGVFTITARYPGDSNFAASTSLGLRQTVSSTAKSQTATTLASSLNPSIYGKTVTFTAKVTTSGPLPPTGTVVFTWKYFTTSYMIGTATLNSSGVATLTRSNLNANPYAITAMYKGDASNLPSISAVVNQVVMQTTSSATITSLLNPSSLGQAVTFIANIWSPTVLPTGPVTFKAGTTVLGSVQLNQGRASYTTTSLPPGSTVIKVTYNESSNIKGSAAFVTQTVRP